MLKKAQRLFLIIPVLVSLFGLNNLNQASANTIHKTSRLTIATTANNRFNEANPVLTQIQDAVKGQALVTPNTAETLRFYILGCFYFVNTTRDDTGAVVCQEAGTVCGNYVTYYASGDATQCEDADD